MSALNGDNITEPSANTPWYDGPAADRAPRDRRDRRRPAHDGPFRMPVQWVNRPDLDFRGFSGTVVGGTVRAGRPRSGCCPRGTQSTVDADRHLRRRPRRRPSPASRSRSRSPTRSTSAAATSSPPPTPRPRSPTSSRPTSSGWTRSRCCRAGPTCSSSARAPSAPPSASPKYKVNVNTLEHTAAKTLRAQRDRRLQPHARPRRSRSTPTPRTATWAASSSSTGSPTTRSAPACCTSRCGARTTSTGRPSTSTRHARAALKGHKPAVVWFTGLSGAGKSTIANLVEKRLHAAGRAHLPARRRQRPPRPQPRPRLHRGRPGREHPPRRRGRRG